MLTPEPEPQQRLRLAASVSLCILDHRAPVDGASERERAAVAVDNCELDVRLAVVQAAHLAAEVTTSVEELERKGENGGKIM